MLDYSSMNWQGDYMSRDIYGEDVDDFIVGVYKLKYSPKNILYINVNKNEIIEVFSDDDFEE